MDPATILVVDDVDDARELLMMVLEEKGYRVVTAADGAEAIKQAERYQPTAVLMDLAMPVMDGVTATRHMKMSLHLRHIPVVAFTAYTSSLEGTDGLFATILMKPCSPDRLLAAIGRLLASLQPEHEP